MLFEMKLKWEKTVYPFLFLNGNSNQIFVEGKNKKEEYEVKFIQVYLSIFLVFAYLRIRLWTVFEPSEM